MTIRDVISLLWSANHIQLADSWGPSNETKDQLSKRFSLLSKSEKQIGVEL